MRGVDRNSSKTLLSVLLFIFLSRHKGFFTWPVVRDCLDLDGISTEKCAVERFCAKASGFKISAKQNFDSSFEVFVLLVHHDASAVAPAELQVARERNRNKIVTTTVGRYY
jgi:hypothetical protein